MPGTAPSACCATWAVANVYEHADAGYVCVEAERRGDTLLLRAMDDGRGFHVSDVERFIKEGHYFFHDVQIRAAQLGGEFHVESGRGKGTALTLTVPLVQRRA